MPEGPEVTTITDGLRKDLKNKILKDILIVEGGKYDKKAPDNYQKFIDNLPLKVLDIQNKGKLIYWTFEKGFYMYNHLNMTGIWAKSKAEKHTALEFIFNHRSCFYIDQRRFGRIEFATDLDKLKKIGPDILNDKSFTFDLFEERMDLRPRWTLSKILMDQSVVSGIGNYLKSEILYASHLNPHRQIENLSHEELETLYQESRRIITESYQNQGMSKRNYIDYEGKKGSFEFKLKVYGKKKDPKGNDIIREKTKDGRSTYWVPKLQS